MEYSTILLLESSIRVLAERKIFWLYSYGIVTDFRRGSLLCLSTAFPISCIIKRIIRDRIFYVNGMKYINIRIERKKSEHCPVR